MKEEARRQSWGAFLTSVRGNKRFRLVTRRAMPLPVVQSTAKTEVNAKRWIIGRPHMLHRKQTLAHHSPSHSLTTPAHTLRLAGSHERKAYCADLASSQA